MISEFPSLKDGEFETVSARTSQYNCIAWAADDNERWWEPDPIGIMYWPPGAPREWTLDGLMAAFETLGYEKCDSGDLEPGFEKVAFYAFMTGEPTHVAWQRPDGRWTSKLGDYEDIIHDSLDGLTGSQYGLVMGFMKRRRQKRAND